MSCIPLGVGIWRGKAKTFGIVKIAPTFSTLFHLLEIMLCSTIRNEVSRKFSLLYPPNHGNVTSFILDRRLGDTLSVP